MNELDSWIFVIVAFVVPAVFILACINTKPHASHVWEFNREMERGIMRNDKGQVISPPKKWYQWWK